MKTRQIHTRLRHQGGQLGNKVQRRRAAPLEYEMGGSVAVRCLSGAA
jgi:hypothetical protein